MSLVYSFTLKQGSQLPSDQAILKFLQQDVCTSHLDPALLEKVAKLFAYRHFTPMLSPKSYGLELKSIELFNLNNALKRCAEGKLLVQKNETNSYQPLTNGLDILATFKKMGPEIEESAMSNGQDGQGSFNHFSQAY